MPLLGSNRFECQPMPENLNLEDEVYVCKATGELFTDYEKFFDQTILCNSLIWTCEVTGHTGMTFTEALESEKNSRKQLEMFPSALRAPILHLVSLTKRTTFKDLLDDIFGFVKDRYFIGEKIFISTGTERKMAVIIKVFPMSNSFNQPLGDFCVDNCDTENDILKKNSSKRRYASESSSFQYLSQDESTGIALMSISKNMSRDKNSFNRDSCKLFLKEHCEHKGKGIWRLKEFVTKRYNLDNLKFTDYFAGPIPIFPGIFEIEKKNCIHEGFDIQDSNLKRKVWETAKDWSKPRDDLLCDDLKDLPRASPVILFDKDFGLAMIVMEFLSCFGSFCGIELPDSFSIFELDKCLKKNECSSFFVDLVQGFLTAIFQMQFGASEIQQAWKVASRGQSDSDMQFGLTLVQFFSSVEKRSKSHRCPSMQETPLKRLPLDGSSLTEVLRLHLLIGTLESSSQMDSSSEMSTGHIASEFSVSNSEIMGKLHVGNILDLKPDEKLKILSTLIDQVLSLPSCRDYIDDKYLKLKNSQKDLRNHIWAIQRRDKDLFNYNIKKRQEEDILIEEKQKNSLQLTVTRAKKGSILDLKDKDFEEMPMEGIDWDQLTREERDHIKNWSERRLIELQNLVDSAQDDYCVTPIGMDRTYRKYWIFKSVPGLFVEDSEDQDFSIPLECLSLTPQNMNKALCKGNMLKEDENTKKSLIYVDAHEQLMTKGKTEWLLYSDPEELESLINGLNDRGYRESNLKSSLIKSKQKILRSMISCDVKSLIKRSKQFIDEKCENQNEFSCPCGENIKAELDLSRSIADMVLDLEERIFAGGLGQLKLKSLSREEWRKGLEASNVHNCKISKTSYGETTENYQDKIMLNLRQYLKDVMEMIDPKYLGPPLGDDEELRPKKLKSTGMQQKIGEGFQRLDDVDNSSITWSKSSLNARCKICRKKKDGESMLLCDKCDQGHHIYCLRPPLEKIPEGDWFCPSCQPKNMVIIASRKISKNIRYKDCDSDFGVDDEGSLTSIEMGFSFNDGSLSEWKEESTVKRNHQRRKAKDNKTKINEETDFSKMADTMTSETQDQSECNKDFLVLHDSEPIRSRVGREIVRPKCDDQFIEEELPASNLKRKEKFCFSDDLCSPSLKRRRNIRNIRYYDDFDYNNDEDCDGFASCINGEKDLKKKKHAHSFKDQMHVTRSKRISSVSSKHSQRKTNDSMKAIEDLVTDLMKNDNAWPFLKPVTLKQAPDYFDIIENPIDLSTIKYKIYRFEYENQNQIVSDLRLMLYNCNLYNCPNTPVHDAGVALESYLNIKLEEIEKHSSGTVWNTGVNVTST